MIKIAHIGLNSFSHSNEVFENLKRIESELAEAAVAAGRPTPALIAVTKSASDEEVLALAEAGAVDIGENRTSMLTARKALLEGAGFAPRMHLIGSLQTNKAKEIVGETALIHSLDRPSLAATLERLAARKEIVVDLLAEINVGREEAKGGLLPEQVLPFHAALTGGDYPHLAVSGLMTMGPVCACDEDYRPFFRETRALFEEIRRAGGFVGDGVLSMGMSDSYRVAAEEWATALRIGRALFRREQ